MPSKAILLLHILADAEPVLTIAALGAFLRVRRQVDLPAMRDYLIVRTAWTLLMGALLTLPLSQTTAGKEIYLYYFCSYWAGQFLLAVLLVRAQ